MESPRKKGLLDRAVENDGGMIPSLLQATYTSGAWQRTRNVLCVVKKVLCLTYYQDVRQPCNKEDTDGGTTEYYNRLQMYWRKNEGKKTKTESTKTIYSVCQARRETEYTVEEVKSHIGLCRKDAKKHRKGEAGSMM